MGREDGDRQASTRYSIRQAILQRLGKDHLFGNLYANLGTIPDNFCGGFEKPVMSSTDSCALVRKVRSNHRHIDRLPREKSHI